MKAFDHTSNPYRVNGPASINFSGGRSSGFLLRKILDAHNGTLPGNLIPVYCNTGKERPETLDFVQRCAEEWRVPIVWLEYRYREKAGGGARDPKHTYEQVDYNTASRHGEPFAMLIQARKYLPNVVQRFCTQQLKIHTTERYLRKTYGWRKFNNVLGIRYDEPNRWGKMLMNDANKPCDSILPLVHAQHTRLDVTRFWDAAPFDLALPKNRSNCDLCFLKGRKELVDTIREQPELVEWWIRMESEPRAKRTGEHAKSNAFFKKSQPYSDLKRLAQQPREHDLFSDDDETAIECHCTD